MVIFKQVLQGWSYDCIPLWSNLWINNLIISNLLFNTGLWNENENCRQISLFDFARTSKWMCKNAIIDNRLFFSWGSRSYIFKVSFINIVFSGCSWGHRTGPHQNTNIHFLMTIIFLLLPTIPLFGYYMLVELSRS